MAKVKDPQRFGVAEIKDGKVITVEEKPKNPRSPFAVVGLYIYDHSIFEAVNHITPGARGEPEISDAHQYLIDSGFDVGYSEITGWWKDTGRPDDLLEANRLIWHKIIENVEPKIMGEVDSDSDIVGKAIVEKGARVIKSVIRGPVIIGENTLVENSYIVLSPLFIMGVKLKIARLSIVLCWKIVRSLMPI